ncbi:MAG: hypothetical protein MN733_14680 [Nitrososphaera sp.]|nr:hypothetical protein [Nitrososphaera sp.]
MKVKGLSVTLVVVVAGVVAGSLVLAGLSFHGLFQDGVRSSLLHTDSADASASGMPLDVKQVFKGREKGGDAQAGSSYFLMDDAFVDDENHCEFCVAVEYNPGPQGKAFVAFTGDEPMNLSDATRMIFTARGENGGESINIYAVGSRSSESKGQYSVNTTSVDYENLRGIKFAILEQVTLTNEWQRYEIDLEDVERSAVTHAFAFEVLKGNGNEKLVIYVDSILYTDETSENALALN